MIDANTRKLGDQIAHLCKQNDLEPANYSQYVNNLIRKLPKDQRPSSEAVLMFAVREIYALALFEVGLGEINNHKRGY